MPLDDIFYSLCKWGTKSDTLGSNLISKTDFLHYLDKVVFENSFGDAFQNHLTVVTLLDSFCNLELLFVISFV